MRGSWFRARRTLWGITVLVLVGVPLKNSVEAQAATTTSTSSSTHGPIEAELIFSTSGAGSTESYRLVRLKSTQAQGQTAGSAKAGGDAFMLVYRWGETDLQRQVLTANWAKEIRADFEALARMSVTSKKILGSHCVAPVEVRRPRSKQIGWFCDSSLSPRDRETWQNTLGRLRHVAEWGWERPTAADAETPPSAPRKKN